MEQIRENYNNSRYLKEFRKCRLFDKCSSYNRLDCLDVVCWVWYKDDHSKYLSCKLGPPTSWNLQANATVGRATLCQHIICLTIYSHLHHMPVCQGCDLKFIVITSLSEGFLGGGSGEGGERRKVWASGCYKNSQIIWQALNGAVWLKDLSTIVVKFKESN